MLELRENPHTSEVFLYSAQFNVIYGLDGTVWGLTPKMAQNWEQVALKQEIPSLFDWQQDPGLYSNAHYAQARVNLSDETHFTAGGSFLQISNWVKDFGESVVWQTCYLDRNMARRSADVQW